MYIRTYTRHVFVFCMYIYVYVHIYTHTSTHIHTHTHTHTHTHATLYIEDGCGRHVRLLMYMCMHIWCLCILLLSSPEECPSPEYKEITIFFGVLVQPVCVHACLGVRQGTKTCFHSAGVWPTYLYVGLNGGWFCVGSW